MNDRNEIAAALAEFQAEMPVVPKSKTAKVPTKTGGGYSYSYADLAGVSEAAMPILSKHGLSFTCLPETTTDQGMRLVGVLLHTSGQYLEGSLPVKGNGPQELGGWLTYGRRYLLGCLTGIVTDTDDDGKHAQSVMSTEPTAATRRMSRAKPAAPESADEPAPDTAPDLRTPAQSVKLFASLNDKGMTDRDDVLQYCSTVIDRDLDSTKNLTRAEAGAVINSLEGTTSND